MEISRRELLVLTALLGGGAATAAALRFTRPVGRDAGDTPVTRAVFAQPAPIGGNPQGRLHLALFTDFNCSACRSGHADMMAAIEDDGDVRLHYLDWPIFGDDSLSAARVAIAADGQGIYPAVHARLMQGPRATEITARQAVVASGGDLARLDEALRQQGAEIDARLSRHAFHAFSLGLRGTPSVLAGSMVAEGALTARQWRRLLRAAHR